MTEQELQRILQKESNCLDWKKGGDPENIVETLTAFANDYEEVGCGFVLCGIEEQKHKDGSSTSEVAGITRGESNRLQNRIFELSRNRAHPPITPRFDSVSLDEDKEVLVVWVAASNELHFWDKKVVIRRADKTVTATINQHSELVLRKAHLHWLDQPCPGATEDDINFFALEEISKGHKQGGGAREFLQPGIRMFASARPLCSTVVGPTGDVVVPNRFAMLLIGEKPHQFMPGAFVALTRFQGLSRADSIFSSTEYFGPIPLLIEKVIGELESETAMITDKTRDFLNGAQNRKRYSVQALNEFLVNALAHRDYAAQRSTKIYIFLDRIEFESPGGLVSGENIEGLKQGRTNWRNPSLARYLSELGLAQERGTGIPRAIEETVRVAGIEPKFETDAAMFKVTVPAYQPPIRKLMDEEISPEAGALLISIGHGTIEKSLLHKSYEGFRRMSEDRVRTYHYEGLVVGEQWAELIRELRNWLRDCMDDPQFQELHLFYRGPVAIGPLIGAMSVSRKPLIVYFHDEDTNLYRFAYRVDRKLLQGR